MSCITQLLCHYITPCKQCKFALNKGFKITRYMGSNRWCNTDMSQLWVVLKYMCFVLFIQAFSRWDVLYLQINYISHLLLYIILLQTVNSNNFIRYEQDTIIFKSQIGFIYLLDYLYRQYWVGLMYYVFCWPSAVFISIVRLMIFKELLDLSVIPP